MSTYKRKTIRYVAEDIGDTDFALVVEGDKIKQATLTNPHGYISFISFRQIQEAVACLTEVVRRFNEEATTEYTESQETEVIHIDGLSRSGQDPLPFE